MGCVEYLEFEYLEFEYVGMEVKGRGRVVEEVGGVVKVIEADL